MEAKRFGRKIKEKRKEHGLTSEKLADKCFINEGYVRQLESGKKIPSMPLLIRMCEILETSPNYLMDFVEDNDDKEFLKRAYKLSPDQKRAMLCILDAYITYQEKENK